MHLYVISFAFHTVCCLCYSYLWLLNCVVALHFINIIVPEMLNADIILHIKTVFRLFAAAFGDYELKYLILITTHHVSIFF